MAALAQHLKDTEYANWVKNTLALKITLGVLKTYVDKEIPTIHASITGSCRPEACSSCNVSRAPDCPNNVCNVVQNEIIESHRKGEPSFCNTNAKKWSTDAWEIAKCFIPPITGYKFCTQLKADFSVVINIIINCKHFDTLVSCDLDQDRNIFCQARKMRNDLMHSDRLTVSEEDLKNNLDLLIRLLSCFKDKSESTPDALEKIEKLRTNELPITPDDVKEVRKQALLAIEEEFDKKTQTMKKFVDSSLRQLRHEMETASSVLKAPQRRLIGNFIKGCKYSLIRLVQSEIQSVKPKRYPQHKWNFKKFLNRIELFEDVELLLDRHKRLLYPEDGSTSDIHKWDIFLLCHILSLELRVELPNHVINYMRDLKATRDEILKRLDDIGEEDNPNCVGEEDLKMLSEYLNEPLRTEVAGIFASEHVTDDDMQLLSVLKSWQQNEANMKCKQISSKALEKEEENARQISKLQTKRAEDREEFLKLRDEVNAIKSQNAGAQMQPRQGVLRSGGNKNEGNTDMIETHVEVIPTNIDPEEEEQIRKNITSENSDENISLSNGGLNHFQENLNLENVKPVKGSIILKVTCKTIEELIHFWDRCMDGSAVRALSKVRDDYRDFLGCAKLDFDIILTKKEVHRCITSLVDRVSSQTLNQSILKEIKAKVAVLETVPEDLTGERMELGAEGPLQDTDDLAREKMELDTERTLQARKEAMFGQPGTQSLDEDKPGFPSTLQLKKDAKHGEDEATRLTKFLRQMAESFEEGNISVVKPYLHDMIKHSKNKDKEAFIKTVLDFTVATSFKGGISVSLIKQAQRGFHMILEEPHFGDLVVAKVEAIEKEDQSFVEEASGFDKSPWPMDVKSTVIIAEDIQVGGTKTSNTQSSPFDYQKSRLGTGSSKEKESGYSEDPTGKVTDFGSKLSETTTISSDTEAYRIKSKGFEQPLSPLQQESPKTGPSGSIETTPKPP